MRLPWRKKDWNTIDFRRPFWPPEIYTWTYDRKKHPVVWAMFGNDVDGCTPWMGGKQWRWFSWWWRNTFNNFGWYVLGLVYWSGQYPNEYHGHSKHLEKRFWIGVNDASDYIISWIRIDPKYPFDFKGHKRIFPYWWRPYLRLKLGPMDFWVGWSPGQGRGTCSFKRR